VPLLARLSVVWEQFPSLRLGQLLLNAYPERPLYYVEDDELIEKVEEYARKTNTGDVGDKL
jgi:hypothetical protein